ncbi:MAG: hypothetical protein R3B45_04060 [Bdellovibrionota bacterium]
MEHLKRDINRFLDAIETGNLPIADAYNIFREFEPLLGYFLLYYLREKHHVTENHSGPGERLLSLVSTYPDVSKTAKKPADDPFVEWFDDTYNMREFFNDRQLYIDTIVDKLEG